MRGKPACGTLDGELERNIPAYAGKTSSTPVKQSVAPEHPRVCGENWPDHWYYLPGVGTSPRMRGKPGGEAYIPLAPGNIPAYAGKTDQGICILR